MRRIAGLLGWVPGISRLMRRIAGLLGRIAGVTRLLRRVTGITSGGWRIARHFFALLTIGLDENK